MISKQIMDKHNEMDRGSSPKTTQSRMTEAYAPTEYDETPVAAKFNIPEEFQQKIEENIDLKAAFEALTPGRQKAYFLHFSAPKQSKTRESRIEKCIPLIFKGKGINDCTCGLSKKMPYCDGSHKFIKEN